MNTEKELRNDTFITSQKVASWKRKILTKITDGEDMPDDIVEGLGDAISEQLRSTNEVEMRKLEDWWSTKPSSKDIMDKFDLQLSMDETKLDEEEEEEEPEPDNSINTEEAVPEPKTFFSEDEVTQPTSPAPQEQEAPAPQEQETPTREHRTDAEYMNKGVQSSPVKQEQVKEDDTHGADKKLVDLYRRYKDYTEKKNYSDKAADCFVRMMRYVYQNPSNSNQEFVLDIFRKRATLLDATPFHEHISNKLSRDSASIFSYMYTIYDSLARSIKRRRRINIDPNAALRALKGKSEIVGFVVERTSKF